ncbi:MAG: DNA-binding protein [Rheinheimera sp.]|nr:MAG: DNA-binding protein [Rheinheimera sp.]
MARDGITKHQVQQVRNELIAQGRHPSVDLVRAELGTGSNTTILKYLRELEADEKGRLDNLSALSDELSQFVGHLAQRLQEEAVQRIQTTEERHHLVLAERQRQLDVLRQELMAVSEHRDKLDHQHREAIAQIEELKDARHQDALQLSSMAAENRHLSGTIQDKEKHILSLEEKHAHARQALEHYRDSVKTQREQEQQRHEHQVQQLHADLRISQQTQSVQQNELSNLKEQVLRLSTQLNHSQGAKEQFESELVQLRQVHQDNLLKNHELTLSLQQIKEHLNVLTKENQDLTTQCRQWSSYEQIWIQEKASLSAALATQTSLWDKIRYASPQSLE